MGIAFAVLLLLLGYVMVAFIQSAEGKRPFEGPRGLDGTGKPTIVKHGRHFPGDVWKHFALPHAPTHPRSSRQIRP